MPGSSCRAIAAAACSPPTPRIAPKSRDDNRRAVDEAKALGAPCIVLVAGGLPQYSRPGSAASKDIVGARTQVDDAHRRNAGICARGQHAARDRAAASGLCRRPRLRQHHRNRRSTSATALDPRRTGALGVALDVYHVWWDPELMAQIARAGKDRLLAFHVCDWLVPTRDILNDRGMMGDGVIDIRSLRARRRGARVCRLFARSRSFPTTGGTGRSMRCCAPASSGTGRWFEVCRMGFASLYPSLY